MGDFGKYEFTAHLGLDPENELPRWHNHRQSISIVNCVSLPQRKNNKIRILKIGFEQCEDNSWTQDRNRNEIYEKHKKKLKKLFCLVL